MKFPIRFFAIALATASAVSTTMAQEPAAAPASVRGVAVDSLNGGLLRGALIGVSGTSRSAITDSLGRFRIDNISPGSYRLEMLHPVLDTAGISVVTRPFPLLPGQALVTVVAVPSPATVIATKCPVPERTRGPGALLGLILDADSDAPVGGARVTLDWTEVQVDRKQFNRIPSVRVATTAADGSFRICGLPSDFTANLAATRGPDSTAVVGVRIAPLLGIVTLRLGTSMNTRSPSVRIDSIVKRVARTNATVGGRVVNENGAPVADARISVDADEGIAITPADGTFRITGVRAGTRLLSVRKIGYEPQEMAVHLSSTSQKEYTVRLSRPVAVLDAVRVTALRDLGLSRVGFAERRKSGSGRYITAEDIERRNPQRLINVLETLPVLRTGTDNVGRRYVTGRPRAGASGCIRYWVDGVPWAAGTNMGALDAPDSFIMPNEIAAIEVYGASETPAQFMSSRFCETVVVWTKWKFAQ